ncbi:copper-binding protein [Leptospira ognonensis]|uniref:Copper-binding protein n=1 Tax=Leptospira ognonensis TaxID=2484945 RepID=A0A4R9JU92_9LEPT|nr:cation transporter [Leptospira ognonensis]TGL55865.1 copper-binding protein [Leptospira ognonensis]
MVNYEISGMTCDHCKMTVEKTFKAIGKLATADVDSEIVSLHETLTGSEYKLVQEKLDEEGYTLGNAK